MKLERFKAIFITIMSAAFAYLGVLAVPVFALVALNFTDYITGIVASKYRQEHVTSYKGIRGICKKIGMWILIGVGWLMDRMIIYAGQYIGLDIKIPFVIATVVAVWLICNEIISILENLLDIGVAMPPKTKQNWSDTSLGLGYPKPFLIGGTHENFREWFETDKKL